jgi:serine/threonine protein kinase
MLQEMRRFARFSPKLFSGAIPMETKPPTHPTPRQLAALALGKLKQDACERLRAHVSTCASCETFLAETPPETLNSLLQQSVSPRNTADQSTPSVQREHATNPALVTSPHPKISSPGKPSEPLPSPADIGSDDSIPLELRKQTKYRIVRLLGRGGMGSVYEAHHERMDRRQALKVINPELVDNPQALLRFEEEVKAVAKLDHPNIAKAYDAESFGSLQAIVMEFVPGQTLYEFLKKRGRLSVVEACRCVRQACLGLQHAHERGLVHRDLKPQNLMLTSDKGIIKILDFGLAKIVSEKKDARGLTKSNMTMGTYEYSAPEQALDAASADIRADIYSLGCTLYYLIAGELPFAHNSDVQLLLAHQHETPRPLCEVRPDTPKELSDLVGRMLAKKPADRPQTPAEVAKALLPFAKGATTLPIGQVSNLSKTSPRRLAGAWPGAKAQLLQLWQRCQSAMPPRFRTRGWLIAAAAAALAGIVLFGVSIMLHTPDGTLVVEVSDPEATIQVLDVQGKVVIEQKAGAEKVEISVVPGKGTLRVVKHGVEVFAQDFTLASGGKETIHAKWEPKPKPKETKVEDDRELSAITELRKKHQETLNLGTPQQKADLAKELLDAAEREGSDQTQRIALLKVASELASENGAFDRPFEVCDKLGHSFANIDPLNLKAELLASSAARAVPQHAEAIAERSLQIGFRCLAIDRFQQVEKMMPSIELASKKSGREDLIYQADFLKEECQRISAHYQRVKDFEQTLLRDATDPKANLEMGKYYCFAKNDWRKGLPMLALGSDDSMRTAANSELASPHTPTARVQLGDLWWELGEKAADAERIDYRRRARYCYLKSLAASPGKLLWSAPGGCAQFCYQKSPEDNRGTLEAEAAKKVQERVRLVPARSFSIRLQGWNIDCHSLRITRDGIESIGNFGRWPKIQLNHCTWAPEIERSLPNSGASRLFPEDIDLTSFDVVVIAKEEVAYGPVYAQLSYRRAEDHVDLNFLHWPMGDCKYWDVLITFRDKTSMKDLPVNPRWDVSFYKYDPAKEGLPPDMAKVVQQEPLERRQLDFLDLFWGPHAPSAKVPKDFIAVIATSSIDLRKGRYKIRSLSDDGVRIFVDQKLVIDDWHSHGTLENQAIFNLTEGKHDIRIEYYQHNGDANLACWIHPLESTDAGEAEASSKQSNASPRATADLSNSAKNDAGGQPTSGVQSSPRWLGYTVQRNPEKAVEEIAPYTNVIIDHGWSTYGDALIQAARREHRRVVLAFYGKWEREAFESRGLEMVRKNRDVVFAVCWFDPDCEGYHPSDLAHFGNKLHQESPRVELWCLFHAEQDEPWRSYDIPKEIDAILLDCSGVASPTVADSLSNRCLPRWVERAAGRPVLFYWTCFQYEAPGLVPKCEVGTFARCALMLKKHNLNGLIIDNYGSDPIVALRAQPRDVFAHSERIHEALEGLVGLQTRPELVREVQDIGKGWKISNEEVATTSGDVGTQQRYLDNQWVDLLKGVDLTRDRVKGNWKREGTGLTVAPEPYARIMLPRIALDSYDVRVEFTRNGADESVDLLLPTGATSCNLFFSGTHGSAHGLEEIYGPDGKNIPVLMPHGTLVNERMYTVDVQVLLEGDGVTINAQLDGESLLSWKGKQQSLKQREGWKLPDARRLGLGAWDSPVTFHNVRLRRLFPSDAKEFGGHYYKVIDTPMTWHLAQEYCEGLGGHLARIESQDEQEFVKTLVGNNKDSYWIDGTDEEKEGTWLFSDGSPVNKYTNWRFGEPNNFDGFSWGKPEHSVQFRADSGANGVWNDARGDIRLPFVCEWDSLRIPSAKPVETVLASTRIPDDSVRFGGHHYKLFDVPTAWYVAKRRCEASGGHLARIQSPEEQKFVEQLIGSGKSEWYSADGSDARVEGTWEDSEGAKLNYSNWDEEQPNAASQGENCLAIFRKNGRWHNRDCGWRIGYICEWDR